MGTLAHQLKTYTFDFRFEILAVILTWILFGGTFISNTVFNNVIFPLSALVLIGVSIAVLKNQRRFIRYVFSTFAILLLLITLYNFINGNREVQLASLVVILIFFSLLSYEVFYQMLLEKQVNRSIIIAAFDCYLLLGIIGAGLFTLLLYFDHDAFGNIDYSRNAFDRMVYFSFVTLTSVGYGDITPATPFAEKLTAFFGLIGHFYSVVVVGIIVGKYTSESSTMT